MGTLTLPALHFAGLLIMTAIPKLLHRAFLVHLLLQTTKGAFDRFAFAAFDI